MEFNPQNLEKIDFGKSNGNRADTVNGTVLRNVDKLGHVRV